MVRLTAVQAVEWLADRLRGTGRVFVEGGPGAPLALAEAYREQPEAAAGLTFVGGWIPGVNRTDWAGLHPHAAGEGLFVAPEQRASFEAGRFRFRPLSYSQAYDWLGATPLDAGLFTVSPPDADGLCSLGTACDLAPAALDRPAFRIAVVNAAMPAPPSAPRRPLAHFDVVVEAETALPGYDPGALDPAFARIAEQVADLLPDAATVQFGIGKAGLAVLAALGGRRGLRIHSGVVTEPVLDLLDEGGVESVLTGMALGSAALNARLAADPRVTFAPVSVTHDSARLAALPRLVAVNGALEVDLFGQVNGEFVDGRQVSGVGGLAEFLRGAARSVGGVPIVALAATARGGAVSRIVPRLAEGAVSVARADVGWVVTELGAADLRPLDLDARAEALTTLAAPAHRPALAEAWDQMRRRM